MADEAGARTQPASIKDRISAFNNLSGGRPADAPTGSATRTTSGTTTSSSGADALPRSPSLSQSLPVGGAKPPSGGVGLDGLGLGLGGGSNGIEVDEFGNLKPTGASGARRTRAGSGSVDGRPKPLNGTGKVPPKRGPAPSLPSRPSTEKSATMLSSATSPQPGARSRGSSFLSTAGSSARSLSPHISPNASPGLKSHSASPRIPVANIISLYNNPPNSSATVTGREQDKRSGRDGALASSPTSEASLDRLPPMVPSPISSRPSSPSKSSSPSFAPTKLPYPNDDLSSLFSGGSASPRPPDTPPRAFTPHTRSGLSSPVVSPSSSRRNTQGSIAIPGAVPEEPVPSHSRAQDIISAPALATQSAGVDGSGWAGAFSLQPPTPYNNARGTGASSPTRSIMSTWPQDGTESPNALHVLRAQERQKRPPTSLAASVTSTSSSLSSQGSSGPPKLPPRRASSGSAVSTPTRASAASLPPSLPPRQSTISNGNPAPAAEGHTTSKTHARNLTNTSFHSVSLSDTDTDPLQSDRPPVHPSSSPQPSSSQSTPTLGSGNLSSFTRAPLPPPKRKGTVSIEPNFPRPPPSPASSKPSTPTVSRQQQHQRQQLEKAKAAERYEGVWEMQCAVEERAGRGPRAGEERRLSAVVVGELWVRSRLPKGVLAQYWTQCDSYRRGSLDREGFIKGMGLIDDDLGRRQKRRRDHRSRLAT